MGMVDSGGDARLRRDETQLVDGFLVLVCMRFPPRRAIHRATARNHGRGQVLPDERGEKSGGWRMLGIGQ